MAVDLDQEPKPADPATGEAPEVDGGVADLEALKAQVASLEAAKAKSDAAARKANDEAAKRRLKAKEADEAHRAELASQGEFKALAESQATRLEEMSGFESDAQRWRAYAERESARIEGIAQKMPEHFAKLLEHSPTLESKQAVIAAWEAESKSAAPKPPSTGAPATRGGPPDFSGLSPEESRQLLAENPEAFRKELQKRMSSKKTSWLSRA